MIKKQYTISHLDGKKPFEYYKYTFERHFDWEKVHKAMIAVGWEWELGTHSDGSAAMGIPSLETLKKVAFEYLEKVYDVGFGSNGTGGFTAGWEDGEMYLVFTFAEWVA